MPDREDRFPRMEALLAALRAGRTRGRRIAAACGALVLAGTVAGGTALAMRGPEVCEGGAARVAEVWHAERRAAGERAFTATGLPYAGEAWGGAAALLDEYGASWTAMYGDACAATQVRGEQSAELLDLRMTCLNHQLAELDALIGLYEGADRSVVRRAVEAASGLPEVRRCADAEALRAGASARGASDPARVEALRSRLVAARTKARAGKAKDVLAELEAIAAESARLGEPSLTATAKLALARAQVATGADEAARASATAAVWQAIGDRDDEALWDSVTQVIAVVGYRLGRKAEATPWIEHARALLRRRGDPEPLRAALLRTIGKVELAAGDLSAAAPPLEEALAIEERTLGEVDARLVDTINALGAVRLKAGRYAEAQALFERSLRVCEATGGRGHPDLVNPLNNLALAFERQGRYDDAIAALREGQALLTAISADDPNIGLIQQNIGGMLHLAGRSAAARPELAAALAHLERTIGPEHPAIAGTLTFSGDVARALGDLGAARAAYARALAVREKALGEKHPELALCLLGLAEVDLLEGRPAEALAQIDRALAGIGEAPFDPGDLGQLHFARAKALRATGAAEASRAAAAAAGAALREAGAAGAKTLAELTRWEQ